MNRQTGRRLSQPEINRSVLARQLLLERAPVSIPTALETVAGIQAQYAPSSYVGLWSRKSGLRRPDLNEALEKREVVQGTLMRTTIHLVSTSDYPLMAQAVRLARRRLWLRQHGHLEEAALVRVAEQARHLLSDGPVRRSDIVARLGCDSATWNGIGLWLDLVRVPPSGTWERRSADIYALADQWIGRREVSGEEATEHLVRRYLAGFGPASIQDVASWSGIPVSDLKPALGRVELRRFTHETGAELLDVPGGPLPDPDTPAPVRLLPTWDATLLAHARRSGILPEEFRTRVFSTRTPHSVSTFLVDGKVAGGWRLDGRRVVIEPFVPLPRSVVKQVEAETEALAAFVEGQA